MTPELQEIIEDAARQAISTWGGVDEPVEDLVGDLWVWYLQRPSVRTRIAEAETDFRKRNTFYRGAIQLLAARALESDCFNGKLLYSVDSIKDALRGESTNRYLLAILPGALDDLERQNAGYREAVRSRYDDGIVPKDKASERRLYHALTALTAHCNIDYVTDLKVPKAHEVHPEARRGKGGYADPTADLAVGLAHSGDVDMLLQDGSTTTYRKEIMEARFDETLAARPAHREMSRPEEGVFDAGFIGQDRADMYRAAVVPELYPDEKPMLIENWSDDDREAYCGGEYTPGYRRLSLVR